MDLVAQYANTIAVAVVGVLVWFYMRGRFEQVDRRFDELKADTDRRFGEQKTDLDRRFEQVDRRFEQVDRRFEEQKTDLDRRFEEQKTDLDRRFEEQKADTDRRFGELRAEMRAGFEENGRQHERFGADIAALRSDLTQIALALGLRDRPKASEA